MGRIVNIGILRSRERNYQCYCEEVESSLTSCVMSVIWMVKNRLGKQYFGLK